MHVGRLEKVGDETVDRKASFELLAEDLESRKSLWEREEASPEAHCHRHGIAFHGLVGDIYVS
jgi:hypothetical protein